MGRSSRRKTQTVEVAGVERRQLVARCWPLRIAVVADTHGRPHSRLTELLVAEKPEHILHAGDIGDLGVLGALEQISPVHAVRGNIDGHASELPDALTLQIGDETGSFLRLLLVHIAVSGIRLRADIGRLAAREEASLVVCGHSHIPFAAHDRGVTVFNPGSVGPRRFDLPIVFGVIEVSRVQVSVRHVSCETGLPWSPHRHNAEG